MPASNSYIGAWTKLKEGNQEALLELYNSHYLGLMNYGIKLTGDRALTNECITKTLLRLWDNRNRLPGVENIRSYLLTCLRNEILAEFKSENRRLLKNQSFSLHENTSEASYEEYLIAVQANKELKEKLHKAFDKLTAREKELLEMKFFMDLDYDEIAQRCNITKRTAYNIIHAAVKTLKNELMKQEGTRLEINLLLLLLPILIKNILIP